MNRLKNHVAVVTRSSSSNGRAIAVALAAEGATVVCADLKKNALKEGYEKDRDFDTDELIRKQGGKSLENDETHKLLDSLTPWPRLGTSEDVAHCVVFLSSPEAEWVTGSMLTVDGAFTAR